MRLIYVWYAKSTFVWKVCIHYVILTTYIEHWFQLQANYKSIHNKRGPIYRRFPANLFLLSLFLFCNDRSLHSNLSLRKCSASVEAARRRRQKGIHTRWRCQSSYSCIRWGFPLEQSLCENGPRFAILFWSSISLSACHKKFHLQDLGLYYTIGVSWN